MRSIKLTATERQTLEEGFNNHPKAHVRKRCPALLLSDRGKTVKDIAALYETRTRTIYTWMNRWQSMGIVGLFILPGRGLKPTLSIINEVIVKEVKKVAQKRVRS